MNWKLLGDLLPSELRLECERAGIAASGKDSHNFIKLSKYIMGNGNDPETFFFNTLYQADKTNPLVGMTPNKISRPVNISSPQAKGTSAEVLAAAPSKGSRPASSSTTNPIQQGTASRSAFLQPSDDNMKTLLGLFSAMATDMKKMVSLLEEKKVKGNQGPPVGSGWEQDDSDDEFSVPYWSSNSSVDSDMSSDMSSASGYSCFKGGRRYDKSMLISDNICLPYQHGSCSYGDDYDGFHPSGHGKKVFHYCGLCWTDSPDNQCYDPAYKCPGPYHNS